MNPLIHAFRGSLNCEESMPEPNSQLPPGLRKTPRPKGVHPGCSGGFLALRALGSGVFLALRALGSGGFSGAPRTRIKKRTHMGRNVVDPQGHPKKVGAR